MSSAGSYTLESTENYDAWLKAVGVPDELAALMLAAKPVLEVAETDNGLIVKTITGDMTFTNSITFGVDSPTDIAGLKYTLNVKKTATGYSGSLVLNEKTGTFAVEDTATGFVQTTTVDGVSGKKIYKKQ